MTPARWRQAALIALWAQVAGLFASVPYFLWSQNFSLDAWFNATEAFLAGLVLAWWTLILGRFTAGRAVPLTDGTLRALGLAFPWLTSFRLVLWFWTLVLVLGGVAPEANTVAVTALLTVSLAGIVAGNAVYGTLARLAPGPADPARHRRLADWLNLAAALSLAVTVFNVVPVAGFGVPPTPTDQVVYGLSGALDVVATLLALRAVQSITAQSRAL